MKKQSLIVIFFFILICLLAGHSKNEVAIKFDDLNSIGGSYKYLKNNSAWRLNVLLFNGEFSNSNFDTINTNKTSFSTALRIGREKRNKLSSNNIFLIYGADIYGRYDYSGNTQDGGNSFLIQNNTIKNYRFGFNLVFGLHYNFNMNFYTGIEYRPYIEYSSQINNIDSGTHRLQSVGYGFNFNNISLLIGVRF